MPSDLRPGPDSPPTDELASAEATLAVLQQVLHTVSSEDETRQTPCQEYDVDALTGHLLNSITTLGGMTGTEISAPDADGSIEQRVVLAARPALDAWHQHGLDGDVPFGDNSIPARVAVGILSIEFLVHAWDYARAVDRDIDAPDSLSEYVLGLATQIIRPPQRGQAGFADPVEVPGDAAALDRLVAFTGRDPAS